MRIHEWYNNSANDIASNQFVTDSEHRAHAENRKQISEFIDLLSKEDESDFFPTTLEDSTVNEPIIFLSHKSDDKKYGDGWPRTADEDIGLQ